MTLAEFRRRLQELADPAQAAVTRGYFKNADADHFLGIRAAPLRALVRELASLPLSGVAKLLKSKWHEERLAALLLLVRRYERGGEDERQTVYDFYMRHLDRVNNWDLVDLSAPHIAGAHLRERDRAPLYELAKSPSLWHRRIAMLATQHFIRHHDFRDALAIAELLLGDKEDLIHKAAGWMLREIGDRDREAEETFLRQHASKMPRTMLRYAIEKFPVPLRRRYLEGGTP